MTTTPDNEQFVPFPVELEINPTPHANGSYRVRWPGGMITTCLFNDPRFPYDVTIPKPPWTDPWGVGLTEEEACQFVMSYRGFSRESTARPWVRAVRKLRDALAAELLNEAPKEGPSI